MGKCEYVDDNANFLDGWHCKIIGGKVDDPDIVGYYCKSSVACEYCPHRGGDDRYRKPKSEEKPEREERYEEKRSGGGSSGYRGGSSDKNKYGVQSNYKVLGVVILLFVLLGVFLFIAAKCGAFRSTVNIQFNIPEGVDHNDISLMAVSLDPEHLYETEEKKFSEDGSCSLQIYDGQNYIYLKYNGVCILLGDAVGDSNNHFARDDFSYDDMQSFLFRTVIVDLQDTKEAPIEADKLTVEDANGEAKDCLKLDGDTFLIVLGNENTANSLTVTAEGYEPLQLDVDLTDKRLEKVLLTFSSKSGGDA